MTKKKERTPKGRNLSSVYLPGEWLYLEDDILDFVEEHPEWSLSKVVSTLLHQNVASFIKKHSKKSSKK